MTGGSTKMGNGRTTRVKAVSMIAWGEKWENIVHTPRYVGFISTFVAADGRRHTWAELRERRLVSRHHPQKKKIWGNVLTCLAATFEEPTTFPLLSITSIPSESSLCLIKATLQMLAVAKVGKKGSEHVLKTRGRQCSVESTRSRR